MPKIAEAREDEELEGQADQPDQEQDDLELVGGPAEVVAPEEQEERQRRDDPGQPDAGQLQLDDQHEDADEQEDPAHDGVGQERDERVDPAGPLDRGSSRPRRP